MWREKRLDELAEIVSGGTPSRDIDIYWGGDVPWVTPTDITACRTNYLNSSKESITEVGLRNSSAKLLPAGAILFTSRATVGESRIAANPMCTNQGFKSLVAKPGVDNRFLFYCVTLNANKFRRYAVGSTFPEINKKDTGRVGLDITEDNAEQAKIADVLETADEAIETTEALIAKYEQIKQGMMQDLFSRGVDESGRLRPPYEEAPHLYRQTDFGPLPSGWNTKELGDLIGRIDSGWSPVCDSDAARYAEWGVLKTTAVVWPGYCSSENKKLPSNLLPNTNIETHKGDILITRKGPVDRVGVCVLVDETPPNLMFPDTVFRTRVLHSDVIRPEFLVKVMQDELVQTYWRQRKIGLAEAQVNLNHGILRGTPIKVPHPDEQEMILDILRAANTFVHSLRKNFEKIRQQKAGLMQDLLTGKVRVSLDEEQRAEAVA